LLGEKNPKPAETKETASEQKDAAEISGKSPNPVWTVRVRSSDQTEVEAGDPRTQSVAMHIIRAEQIIARPVLCSRQGRLAGIAGEA